MAARDRSLHNNATQNTVKMVRFMCFTSFLGYYTYLMESYECFIHKTFTNWRNAPNVQQVSRVSQVRISQGPNQLDQWSWILTTTAPMTLGAKRGPRKPSIRPLLQDVSTVCFSTLPSFIWQEPDTDGFSKHKSCNHWKLIFNTSSVVMSDNLLKLIKFKKGPR